ncbi:MAG: GDCCVxC domain-containing (seleno)protein [Candidatus Paceibacteria bacterium]
MDSTLICPKCSHEQTETIPQDSCLPFYICENCSQNIQAKEKDCCVFCSYGDKDCPVSHEQTTDPEKIKEEFSCPNCENKDSSNTEILLWILAVIAIFAAATAFGWNVFYGYVVPQATQAGTLSLAGLFGFSALAGLIVNFGPCSLAVLPAYLAYQLGLEDKQQETAPIKESSKLGLTAAVGIVGFYLVLGIAFAGVGTYLSAYSAQLKLVIAGLILLFGVGLLLERDFGFSLISKFKNFINKRIQGENKKSTLIGFGVAYAAGGLSCFLPVFLPLIFYPFLSGNFVESVVSFIIFAAMQALFLITATILVGLGKKNIFQGFIKNTSTMKKAAGIILILTSCYMFGIFLFLGM